MKNNQYEIDKVFRKATLKLLKEKNVDCFKCGWKYVDEIKLECPSCKYNFLTGEDKNRKLRKEIKYRIYLDNYKISIENLANKYKVSESEVNDIVNEEVEKKNNNNFLKGEYPQKG